MNSFIDANYPITKEFTSGKLCTNINEKTIIRNLGYDVKNVPEPVIESIRHAFKEINNLKKLRGGYLVFDKNQLQVGKEFIIINKYKLNTKKIISSNLKEIEYIAVLVATIGSEITSYLTKLMEEGDTLTGYIADQIASELVECWADDIEAGLSDFVNKNGMKITNRYSPGYCGWDVADQHEIFSLLPENYCGVSLTENALMIPIKSISAIVGIGEKAERRDYQCSICDMEFCYKRGRNE